MLENLYLFFLGRTEKKNKNAVNIYSFESDWVFFLTSPPTLR